MDEKIIKTINTTAESLNELQRSIDWVNKTKDSEDREFRLDAVAKRFEVSFEYTWKAFKGVAEWEGTSVPGPRAAIQAAHQYGWIDDVNQWAAFLEARNYGAHDYFGLSSEEYFKIASDYAEAAKKAVSQLQKKHSHIKP